MTLYLCSKCNILSVQVHFAVSTAAFTKQVKTHFPKLALEHLIKCSVSCSVLFVHFSAITVFRTILTFYEALSNIVLYPPFYVFLPPTHWSIS